MARKEARISTSVWRNRMFTDLPLAAQGLYWMLLAQPDVSMCGVLPYLPGRWAALCGSDDHIDALGLLEQSGFVVVDRDTSELLVRTFVKWDGVLRGPKTRSGMWKAWAGVLSDRIRRVVLDQASDWVDEAVEKGWTDRATVDAVPGIPDPPDPDAHTDIPPHTPSGQGVDTPSDTPPDRGGTSDHRPPTTNHNPCGSAASEPIAVALSTALGHDALPPPGTRARDQLDLAARDIAAQGGHPHDVPQRVRGWPDTWGTATPMAIAKHWPQLRPSEPPKPRSYESPDPSHGLRAAGLLPDDRSTA